MLLPVVEIVTLPVPPGPINVPGPEFVTETNELLHVFPFRNVPPAVMLGVQPAGPVAETGRA